MLFSNVAPSPFDLSFRLFGFPVRITPGFWIVSLLLSRDGTPESALTWVAAVLISIVVHELGHAFVQRAFGGDAHIVLYSFGGYASAEGVRDSWWRSILISLAGPSAGFLLYGLLWLGIATLGVPASPLGQELLGRLLYINLIWGLINLLPVYPLDGGRVARELLTRLLPAPTGVVSSLLLSIVAALGMAVWAYSATGSLWNTALFAVLAYENYQTLQQYNLSRGWQ